MKFVQKDAQFRGHELSRRVYRAHILGNGVPLLQNWLESFIFAGEPAGKHRDPQSRHGEFVRDHRVRHGQLRVEAYFLNFMSWTR